MTATQDPSLLAVAAAAAATATTSIGPIVAIRSSPSSPSTSPSLSPSLSPSSPSYASSPPPGILIPCLSATPSPTSNSPNAPPPPPTPQLLPPPPLLPATPSSTATATTATTTAPNTPANPPISTHQSSPTSLPLPPPLAVVPSFPRASSGSRSSFTTSPTSSASLSSASLRSASPLSPRSHGSGSTNDASHRHHGSASVSGSRSHSATGSHSDSDSLSHPDDDDRDYDDDFDDDDENPYSDSPRQSSFSSSGESSTRSSLLSSRSLSHSSSSQLSASSQDSAAHSPKSLTPPDLRRTDGSSPPIPTLSTPPSVTPHRSNLSNTTTPSQHQSASAPRAVAQLLDSALVPVIAAPDLAPLTTPGAGTTTAISSAKATSASATATAEATAPASHIPPPPWTLSVYNLSNDTVHIEHPNHLGTTSTTGLPLETRRFRRFRTVRVTRIMHDIAMGRTRGAHAFLFRRAVGPHFLALCRHTRCFLRDSATAAALRASAPAPPAAAVLHAPPTPTAPAARSLLRAAANGLRRAERQLPLTLLSDVHLGFTRVFSLDDPVLHSLPLVRDVIPPAPLALPLTAAAHDNRSPVLSLAVSYRPVASAAASVLAIPAAAWPPLVAIVRALCRRLGLSAFRLWTDRVLAVRKPPAPLRAVAARVLPFLLFPTLVIAPSAAHEDATRIWGAVEQLAAGLGHGIIHPGAPLPSERVPRLWVGPHVSVSYDPIAACAASEPCMRGTTLPESAQQSAQQPHSQLEPPSPTHPLSQYGQPESAEYSCGDLKRCGRGRTDRRPRAPMPDSPPRLARRGSIDVGRGSSAVGGAADGVVRLRAEIGGSGGLKAEGYSGGYGERDDEHNLGSLGNGSLRQTPTVSAGGSWQLPPGSLKRASSRATDNSLRETDGSIRRSESSMRDTVVTDASARATDGSQGGTVYGGGEACGNGCGGEDMKVGLTWVGGLQHEVLAGMRHLVAAVMCGLVRDKTVRWANEAQELLEWASVMSSTVLYGDLGHVVSCDDCSRPIGYTSHDRVMTLLSSATAITPGSPDAFAIARAYPMVDVPAARVRLDGRTWDGLREWVAESCLWGSETDERGDTRRSVLDNTKGIVVSDGSQNALAILQFAIADSTPDRLLVAYLLVGLCTETRNRSVGVAEWTKRFWPAAPMQLWGHFETVYQDTRNRDALSAMALLVGAASGLDYTDIACASDVTTVNVRKVRW